jgi:ferrochelatase
MIGVLLTGYGGPESLDDVGPFLESIAGRRRFSPEQVEGAKKRYRLIGGKSPLKEITGKQAAALEALLNRDSRKYSVEMGMLHLPPYIPDVIGKIAEKGISKLALLTLAPFDSRVSTTAYFNKARKALEDHKEIEAVFISEWNRHPGYIQAVARGINDVLSRFPEESARNPEVIFSIHSLPVKYIDEGDRYVDDINVTVEKVLPLIRSNNWHLAYQSKGRGENWLEPNTEAVMRKLKEEGKSNIVIAPIGFISDHVETLYDIDISCMKTAEELGVRLERAPSLNDSPLFIEALADLVRQKTAHWR